MESGADYIGTSVGPFKRCWGDSFELRSTRLKVTGTMFRVRKVKERRRHSFGWVIVFLLGVSCLCIFEQGTFSRRFQARNSEILLSVACKCSVGARL